MVKIILLGRCCRVSFDMIDLQLKSESSLFEWVWSDTLNEVNIIIKKIINNEPILINRKDNNDYMNDTNIKTSHYLNKNYNEIVIRRSERFLNDIKTQKEILFIRDDTLNTIKIEEIEQFFIYIKQINPILSFKFLLLSSSNLYQEIKFPNLYHKKYNKSLYKTYINECYNIDNYVINVNKKDDD